MDKVKMQQIKISVVVPAYNEEKRIGKTLDRFFKILPSWFGENFEIIVILNGCKDKTLNVIKALSEKKQNLRFKNFEQAIGKGTAIVEGFKIAKGEYVSFVDADGATGPYDFIRVMKGVGTYDGAIASRWLGASKKIDQPFLRKVVSRGFNLLVRTLFIMPYKDTQCGAKIIKKTAIDSIINDLGISGFAFDVELLYLLNKKRYKIVEVPIRWKHDKHSTLNLRTSIPLMLLAVIRLRIMESPFRFIIPQPKTK
jgi:glycosyltransferase involved in cell wall biosynthesis